MLTVFYTLNIDVMVASYFILNKYSCDIFSSVSKLDESIPVTPFQRSNHSKEVIEESDEVVDSNTIHQSNKLLKGLMRENTDESINKVASDLENAYDYKGKAKSSSTLYRQMN